MARYSTITNLDGILGAAKRWKERCLLESGSVFGEGQLWTANNVDFVNKYFVQNPLEGKQTFLQKLKQQLTPAEPAVKQLAAEMVWALLLFPSNIGGNTKRKNVLEVWSWSGVTIDQNHPMLAILDYGIGSGGIAYNNKRPWELAFLTELMQAMKAEGSPASALLSSNPWKFGNWIDHLPSTGKRQFRHMMLYMLFPDEYERVSSTTEKQKIVQAFPQFLSSYAESPDESDSISVDRKLAVVRKGLERQYQNQEIDFYEPPVKALWKPDNDSDSPSAEATETEEEAEAAVIIPSYTVDAALEDVFMEPDAFQEILDTLKLKRNVILHGPPGVGKSFIAQELAYALIKAKDPERVKFIQFHQSYSYEDFIEGFRPTPNGTFELKHGLFRTFSEKARSDPQNQYVLVIDEINRGNLSKIFGELLLLIESDKRSQKYALNLAYSNDSFYVPANLFLIGLMNTADRSLALVDYAIRRRFAFIPLFPMFAFKKFRSWLTDRSSEALADAVIARVTELNKVIEDDPALGSGFCIGHSFFCPGKLEKDLDYKWFKRVVRTEIQPLLEEYWYDNPKRSQSLIEKLNESL